MSKSLRFRLIPFVVMAIMFIGTVSFSQVSHPSNAFAGAEISGQAEGSDVRAIITSNGTDKVQRVVYFKMENHLTGGANTPVASGKVCGLAGEYHYAEVQFTGTLTGSAPTLAIKWQNSKDNGVTWSDVGTWTTINATVTPATQAQTVGDSKAVVLMNANTPVVTPAVMYGDCWRATYTMGAGGAGNFAIIGADK